MKKKTEKKKSGRSTGTLRPARAVVAHQLGLPARYRLLLHLHNRQRLAICQRQFHALAFDVAMMPVERDAGQRGAHLAAREALGARRLFAQRQQAAADSLPRPVRMHKERANLRRIRALGSSSASSRPGRASAPNGVRRRDHPPQATSVPGSSRRLGHEVGLIRNQLRVQPQPRAQSLLNLRCRVGLRPQAAHRCVNQGADAVEIGDRGQAKR